MVQQIQANTAHEKTSQRNVQAVEYTIFLLYNHLKGLSSEMPNIFDNYLLNNKLLHSFDRHALDLLDKMLTLDPSQVIFVAMMFVRLLWLTYVLYFMRMILLSITLNCETH